MSKTPKLAYIIGTYPLVTTTFIDREIVILRQWGADIQIVSIRRPASDAPLSPEQRELGRNVIYLLPANWLDFLLGNLYFIALRPLIYFGTLSYLLSRPHPSLVDWVKTFLHFGEGIYAAYLLRGQPPSQLHAHFVDRAATVALIAGRLLHIPYSVTAHASDIYTTKVLLYEKLREARLVVTVSEFNKAYLLDAYPGLDPSRIHVLHSWVDVSRFRPAPFSPHHGTLRILSVGRMVEKKGHKYLVEACHLLHTKGVDVECRIVGGGPLKSELEEDIERYELRHRVQLLGAQPQSKVQAHIAWCDVFVLACVVARDGDRDGMPVALAEAMAMARPVVSCQIVGIEELVRPGTGLLVLPRSAGALAEALQAILAHSEAERAAMGQRGRAVVEADFNLVAGTRQLMALFQAVCASTN